jgi:hypothetical protein
VCRRPGVEARARDLDEAGDLGVTGIPRRGIDHGDMAAERSPGHLIGKGIPGFYVFAIFVKCPALSPGDIIKLLLV